MGETSMMPVSTGFLTEGMTVTADIYNFDTSCVLVSAGKVLDAELIAKIKRANRGNSRIHVPADMYHSMRLDFERKARKITTSERLESETGYTKSMSDTTDIMRQIADSGDLRKEAVYSASSEVARRLRITKADVIFDLINALAPEDEYLRRHVVNVSMLNGLMGRWLGLSRGDTDKLVLTGLIHDCGKAAIPAEILDAPRRLTISEFEVMKTHPLYSYQLLAELPDDIRVGARHHHEKMNGSGYPDCLSGKDVPLTARVSAISDIYDAMVSRRVYKAPMSPFKVLTIITELKGADLDPELVDLFVEKMPEELTGKGVLLSNGETAVVAEVDRNDLEFPYVLTDGGKVKTGEDLRCVCMLIADEQAKLDI